MSRPDFASASLLPRSPSQPTWSLLPAYASGGIAADLLATAASCSQACRARRPVVLAGLSPLPDLACTPGAKNPHVTQATIGSTICVSGWIATIRPSTTYTSGLKKQGIIDYGYSDTNISDYEEDHFVPLELGGARGTRATSGRSRTRAPRSPTAGLGRECR